MTRTELKLVAGFGALGLLALCAAVLVAAAVFIPLTGVQELGGATAVQAPAALTRVLQTVEAAGGQREISARPEVERAPLVELPLPAPQLGAEANLPRLYEQVTPGVVSIEVVQEVRSPFGGRGFFQRGSGSGFVYDDEYVVTNNHVVGNADTVELIFFDDQRRAGKVVAVDRFTDLAVVRVEDMPSSARALPLLHDFDELAVGQPVVAIGNPFGNANTMTYGIISALGRVIPSGLTDFAIPQAIQTDAAINPGNSGGPLLDLQGRVIGVNAQINTSNVQPGGPPGNSGVGFAIPASIVARVVPALIRDGAYDWAYLGVTGLSKMTLEVAKANNLPDTRGAYITSVVPGGPSDGLLHGASNLAPPSEVEAEPQEGLRIIPLQPTQQIPLDGDFVVAVDGRPVYSFDDLLTYVALEARPGQTVTLTVWRDGREITVPVTLGSRPREGRVQQ